MSGGKKWQFELSASTKTHSQKIRFQSADRAAEIANMILRLFGQETQFFGTALEDIQPEQHMRIITPHVTLTLRRRI